jgi:hypothetical protein
LEECVVIYRASSKHHNNQLNQRHTAAPTPNKYSSQAMLRLPRLVLIFSLNFASLLSESVFNHPFTEETLLSAIADAEQQLKIYLYEVPHQAGGGSIELKNALNHFKSEYLLMDYFRSAVYRVGKRSKSMCVTDPEDANTFLIVHHVYTGVFENMVDQVNHLKSVIDAVLQLPYYDKNEGRDHYFMAVHATGAFLMNEIRRPLAQQFLRIKNANYIGNFGSTNSDAFRIGRDIVIPQFMGEWPNMFLEHANLLRPYDSVWSGSDWGDREPLKRMARSPLTDYNVDEVELFAASFGGRRLSSSSSLQTSNRSLHWEENHHYNSHRLLIDSELAHKGYFGYNPCGQGCWSQRLYFQLTQGTIPIIVSSRVIHPFERFLNWSTFTMKITSQTWNSPPALLHFRRDLRVQCDAFRDILNEYIMQMKLNETSQKLQNSEISSLVDGSSEESSLFMRKLEGTKIWKKMKNMKIALPWTQITNSITPSLQKHAFKLVTLELWCRLNEQTAQTWFCKNPPNSIADKEYY